MHQATQCARQDTGLVPFGVAQFNSDLEWAREAPSAAMFPLPQTNERLQRIFVSGTAVALSIEAATRRLRELFALESVGPLTN
jgi:hypothetical protein